MMEVCNIRGDTDTVKQNLPFKVSNGDKVSALQTHKSERFVNIQRKCPLPFMGQGLG